MSFIDQIGTDLTKLLYELIQNANGNLSEYELINKLIEHTGVETGSDNIFREPALLSCLSPLQR